MTNQKKWTKKVLETFDENGFHPTDIEYGNGYFIIERGEDMVVHFHIKELKGWKFGIWWDLDGDQEFDFFTQYERDIDKFKPAASTFVKENVVLEDWNLKDLVEMCRFIKKHPYRAWALDQSYTRDIWEWGTLNGALKKYAKRWWTDTVRLPRVHEKMTKRYLKIVESITNICLINAEIIDGNEDGWVCSPRFHIVCDGATSEELHPGHYVIYLKEQSPDWLLKKIDRYNKKMEKVSKKYWRIYDIELGDELEFTVRKEKVCQPTKN